MYSFHESICPPKGTSKRKLVLDLMRLAGYHDDVGKWLRLKIENPIGHRAAQEAWNLGAQQRKRAVAMGQCEAPHAP